MKSLFTAIFVMIVLSIAASWASADSWVLKPSAIQTVYRNGVPHTDRNGNYRSTYNASASYLPLMLWGTWTGSAYNQTWSFSNFAAAGFNGCSQWNSYRPTIATFDSASASGIQVITYDPSDAEVTLVKDHPATLGWYMYDEPTGSFWDNDMQGHYDTFLTRKNQIKSLGDTHPVFVLDCSWIMPPATDWWIRWNTSGDIGSHDNYPIASSSSNTLSFVNGIPETVSLAVSANNQSKPLWLVVQAFEGTAGSYSWVMPTPAQERCMVYTGIIHGATGIWYFTLDSYVSRNGRVIGMGPYGNSKSDYGNPGDLIATSDQLTASRQLWYGVVSLNAQLAALRPAILSPTSSQPYEVYVDSSIPSVTPNPIRTMLKTDPAGGQTLLLTNIDAVQQRVKVRFPNKSFVAEELYGSLGFTKSADSIELTTPGWDSRILRIFDMETIGDIKNRPGIAGVACSGIVSAVFGDFFYIENVDRTYGIRVNKAAHGRAVGQIVNVAGTVQALASGEMCLVASDVWQDSTPGSGDIRPLGMTNKAIGGGQLGPQNGVEGGVGLNNIGLLVRGTGKVGTKGANWFMIDDGSGVSVKVYGTVPSGTPYVTVTGASSCERDSSNKVQRVIQATAVQTM